MVCDWQVHYVVAVVGQSNASVVEQLHVLELRGEREVEFFSNLVRDLGYELYVAIFDADLYAVGDVATHFWFFWMSVPGQVK